MREAGSRTGRGRSTGRGTRSHRGTDRTGFWNRRAQPQVPEDRAITANGSQAPRPRSPTGEIPNPPVRLIVGPALRPASTARPGSAQIGRPLSTPPPLARVEPRAEGDAALGPRRRRERTGSRRRPSTYAAVVHARHSEKRGSDDEGSEPVPGVEPGTYAAAVHAQHSERLGLVAGGGPSPPNVVSDDVPVGPSMSNSYHAHSDGAASRSGGDVEDVRWRDAGRCRRSHRRRSRRSRRPPRAPRWPGSPACGPSDWDSRGPARPWP